MLCFPPRYHCAYEKRSAKPVSWENLPEKVAGQLNDSHPTLCIRELIRLLMDVKGLSWKQAWDTAKRTIAYTNHTVLPEALEKWSLEHMQELLPWHVEIIKVIDEELLHAIISKCGTRYLGLLQRSLKQTRILDNIELPKSVQELLVNQGKGSDAPLTQNKVVSEEETKPTDEEVLPEDHEMKKVKEVIFEPDPALPKMVRMANLCVASGHAVNGVAKIHSEIVKNEVFNEFYKLWPEKFQNKTNGVSPRRWLLFCNPDLSKIITNWTGTTGWVKDTEKLAILRKVKRIHEYKWRLLNVMGIVYRYKKMKEMSSEDRTKEFIPWVCIFGGKAFATYVQAKRIVKFITDVGATINHDPEIGDLLKHGWNGGQWNGQYEICCEWLRPDWNIRWSKR